MGWIILIAMIILGIVVLCKKDVSTTTQSTGKKINQEFRRFDETTPNEIGELAYALSIVAAIAGDSHVYVYLQNDNPGRGFTKGMGILAALDDTLDNRQNEIPKEIRKYLESVPFSVKKNHFGYSIEYSFKNVPDSPTQFSQMIASKMKHGASSVSYVKHGLHEVSIENLGGNVNCHIR